MRDTLRLSLLATSLMLSLGCQALAQESHALGAVSPSSGEGPTKHLTNTKGSPVTGQRQAAAQWKEPEQSEPRIDEPLRNLPSRDTALEEARTAPEAEALAQAHQRADVLAQELAAARHELAT